MMNGGGSITIPNEAAGTKRPSCKPKPRLRDDFRVVSPTGAARELVVDSDNNKSVVAVQVAPKAPAAENT